LCATATRTTSVGYIDLPRLVAAHPLHKVLDGYDREIAGLRATRTVPGLVDPAASATQAAAALRRDAANARRQVARIASVGAQRDPALEARALAAVRASHGGRESAMTAYAAALARETSATMRGYEAATAQSTARAFAARQQQLREKELALAYDIARRDAGARLALRANLADIRLEAAKRARLEAQLAALSRRESAAVAALHAQDAPVLARYRDQLAREAAAANAQMASHLRSKANANLALRVSVLRSAAESARLVPDVPERLAAFGSSYRLESDAAAIQGGLRGAAADVPQRFAQLAAADRASRADVSTQLANLQRDRAEVYRAMIAQITRDAERLGQQRGMRIVMSSPRPKGSVDVTGVIEREESGF
jgi:hypothetical protein